MKGTFINHMKVIEREQKEVGLCKKMFLTIEPYNPGFKLNLKDIKEENEPFTPSNICEVTEEENFDDGKNTTKDSESPYGLTP